MDAAEYDDLSMFYPEQLDDVVRATAEALHATYRTKINELEAQLLIYRVALEEAGVELPDRSGDDLLRLMRIIAALTEASTDFAQFFGSGQEMWTDKSWRP